MGRKPVQTVSRLTDEHRLIERVCDAFAAFGGALQNAPRPDDRAELGRFVDFLGRFADGSHHRKEQDILFPAMVAARLYFGDEPARLLADHDKVRKYASVFSDFAARGRSWNAIDRERLGQSTHGYVELLRQHFHDEETFLYPLAEHHMEPAVQATVDSSCERLDAADDGSLRVLGDELVARRRLPAGA